MQVVLVMFKGDGERRSFSLARDISLIGRREDCDLRIPLGDISRKHCRLIKEDGALRVEDLGSSNGTFVNAQRVQESPVVAGDVLRVGPVSFVVQIDGQPADDQITFPQESSDAADTRSGIAASAPTDQVTEYDPASDLAPAAPEDSAMDFVIEEPAESHQSAIVDLEQLQAEAESEDDPEHQN